MVPDRRAGGAAAALGPTPSELSRLLTTLNKAEFSRLLKVVLDVRGHDAKQPLSTTVEAGAYLYEWIKHLGIFGDDVLRYILRVVQPTLSAWAVRYEAHPRSESALHWTISLVDKRYAVWSGSKVWLDLREEREVSESVRGKEFFICDLRNLLLEKREWLSRLRGGQDVDRTDQPRTAGAGDPEQP